jgi:hypothetical protein
MAVSVIVPVIVPVIVSVIMPVITVVVIMVIVVVVSDTIRRLPHTQKLATAGGHGHVAFYCFGGGAAGNWASLRFICWNCGESVRSEASCEAGTAASMRSMSAIRSCVPG